MLCPKSPKLCQCRADSCLSESVCVCLVYACISLCGYMPATGIFPLLRLSADGRFIAGSDQITRWRKCSQDRREISSVAAAVLDLCQLRWTVGRSVVTARLCLIISLEEIVWDVAVIRFRAWRPYPGASSRPLAGQSKWLYHRGEDPGYKSATIQARAPRPRLSTFCLTIIYEFYQT